VVFPQTCWAWWGADKKWYKGKATGISPEQMPSYTVFYPDSSEKYTELSQFVVFADPTPILPAESKSAPVVNRLTDRLTGRLTDRLTEAAAQIDADHPSPASEDLVDASEKVKYCRHKPTNFPCQRWKTSCQTGS